MTPRAHAVVASEVVARLSSRSQTLATAESLTGGLVGEWLTSVPGASACYLGGVITYATRLKHSLAGVPLALLEARGPVAAETAAAMAMGIAEQCGADWGIATTGVAGPDTQDGHQVGQVFIAVARSGPGTPLVRELFLPGDRAAIRAQAAAAVLELLDTLLVTDVLG